MISASLFKKSKNAELFDVIGKAYTKISSEAFFVPR